MQFFKVALSGLVTAVILATAPLAFAAKSNADKFPKGCHNTGFTYEHGYLVLRPNYEKQNRTLFLIKNNTSYNIELKTVKDPNDLFMPEYDQTLPRYKTGVFAMEKPELHFKCIHVKGNNNTQEVRCDNVFQICEYDYAKFPHASMGTYWLDKTGTMRQAMWIAIKSGILLRWSKKPTAEAATTT